MGKQRTCKKCLGPIDHTTPGSSNRICSHACREVSFHADVPSWKRKEIIICAAVKTVEGKIIRGHRHDGAMRYAQETMHLTLVPYGQDQQGFVTSTGRYVNRVEAAAIQKAAGIKSVDPNSIDFPSELFSEDLY